MIFNGPIAKIEVLFFEQYNSYKIMYKDKSLTLDSPYCASKDVNYDMARLLSGLTEHSEGLSRFLIRISFGE